MNELQLENIPWPLVSRDQWVMWKIVDRDGKPDKLPYQINNDNAKVNDATTWTTFTQVTACHQLGNFSGIGYVFDETDPFCGIDLDGARDPITGKVAPWAKEIILAIDSYAEVSPSKTGIKLWVVGKSPFDKGRKKLLDFPAITDKKPAIEIYDHVRYFAVTGWRLSGPVDPQPRDIAWLKDKFWPIETPPPVIDWNSEDAVVERARKYIAKLPPAVAGEGGHNACFRAACVLAIDFGLSESAVIGLLREFNQTCQPPWSERELMHKVQSAFKQPGPRNRLRNERPENYEKHTLPAYESPKPERIVKVSELSASAREYIERVRSGGARLIDLGLADVDHAIGGGVEAGEIIVIGARPSHGKSAAALQIVHQWAGEGRPCLIVSEEMSRFMLGKRTLQFISDIPLEHWENRIEQLERAVDEYEERSAATFIAESCGTAAEACAQIEAAKREHGIELVVVDYAQLLGAPGKGEYERITNTSRMLVETVKRCGVTAVLLCQLNRDIESRANFTPITSDLKGSGQFEQDADVILFMVWPFKIDNTKPANEYKVFVAKNRNREILNRVVTCRFNPSRQTIMAQKPLEKAKQMQNYNNAFAEWESNTEEF